MNNIKCLVLILLLNSLFLISTANSATINAAGCSVADITTAIGSASNGDIVRVPAGNCSWNTTLTLDKRIALIGAGTGNTNITTTGASGYIAVTNGTNNWRISGFSFSTTTSSWFAIMVNLYSSHTNTDWRIDHNTFTGYHYAIYSYGTLTGVIDQNYFYGGGITIDGNNNTNWAAPTALGGSNFVFVEDNQFSDTGAVTQILHVMYAGWGARVVFRYNTITAETSNGLIDGIADAADAHGYCHGSNIRGTRAYEIYNNTYYYAYKT